MPSTITLANTINGIKAYIEQQPVQVNGMEPALSAANLIKQVILMAPLAWPFNRAQVNYSTTTQDYTVSGITDFGFLEGASVQLSTDTKPWALEVKMVMETDASSARPRFLSPLFDDGQGNITFRLMPAPDPTKTAAINLFYQRKAQQMLSMAALWTPIPDDKIYMADWGFLAMMSLIGNDDRFNEYNAKFITSVLASQGGLSATEKALFAANWDRALSNTQTIQLETQERFKARQT